MFYLHYQISDTALRVVVYNMTVRTAGILINLHLLCIKMIKRYANKLVFANKRVASASKHTMDIESVHKMSNLQS